MNKILKITFVLFLSLTFFACSEDENLSIEDTQTIEANEQLAKILNARYGITTKVLGSNSFEFTYLDGRTLKVESQNGEYIASGSRINNKEMEVTLAEGSENIENRLQFKNSENDEMFEKQDFISTVNDYSNLSNDFLIMKRPCSQHPSNESFDDCFAREWDEFCDGFVSCVAQATNPVPVALAIAGHCAAC